MPDLLSWVNIYSSLFGYKMLHSTSHLFRKHKKSWFKKQSVVNLRERLLSLSLILLILLSCHVFAMIILEGMSLWEALWLTLTTITTVGYGDLAPKTFAGQLATVGLLYIPGIALLGQIIGEFIDYRITRRERMVQGLWRWTSMKDHILILNTPLHDGDQYLLRLAEQISKTPELCELPLQILSPVYPDGLPPELQAKGVVHYSGTPTSSSNLKAVNAEDARYIFVISHDAFSINPDSQSIDILEHLNSLQLKAYIVAECVDDENRNRFLRLAANSVIRPIRAYPELVVRALVAPGIEQVMENLFTYDDAHPNRYQLDIDGLLWKEIVCAIMNAGHGTALAYVNINGEVETNPTALEVVRGIALIVMVNHDEEPSQAEITESIRQICKDK